MKKKLVSLLLSCVLLCCCAFGAHAESVQGKAGMKVTFDGKAMKTNYKLSDLTKTAVNLLPGDSATFELRLENTSDTTAAMYMSNAVAKSMEEKGGVYTYDLRYLGDDGTETVVFDSISVGGEGAQSLVEAVEPLDGKSGDRYFFLGNQSSGSGGTVRMTIALDGETQGNDYQDALADLRMNFAAVEAPNGSTGPSTPSNSGDNGGNGGDSGRSTRPVKTGDETDLYPYYLAAGVSGLLLLFLFFFRRKKEEDEEEEA